MNTAVKQDGSGRRRTPTGEYFNPWRSNWSLDAEKISLVNPANPYRRERDDSDDFSYRPVRSSRLMFGLLGARTPMQDINLLLIVCCVALMAAIVTILCV